MAVDQIEWALRLASIALEAAAAVAVVAGAAVSLAVLAQHRDLRRARIVFAHSLLYGFDFAIASDIIQLAVVADLRGAAVTGTVVAVRVVMTVLLLWEIRHE